MSYGVVSYTDFMVVGIDQGVLCCEACGALVPFDRRGAHDPVTWLSSTRTAAFRSSRSPGGSAD